MSVVKLRLEGGRNVQAFSDYDPEIPPSVAVPKVMHQEISTMKDSYTDSARDLLAR